MKKKIWIDTSFVLDNPTGMGQYVKTVLSCLKKYNPSQVAINYKYSYKTIVYMLWLNVFLYIKSLLFRPSLIIFPAFFMPFMTVRKMKYCTVIHDLCSFRAGEMTSFSEYIYTKAIENAVKKADTIITVSETIKNELMERFNIEQSKIKVIYNAIAENFINTKDNPEVLDKYQLKKGKYILSVATLNKRKNIPELTKAFEYISDKYPDLKLVLVGGMGNEQRENLSRHSNVIFTGYIPDEDIPTLYRNAIFYMYPSLYEGFGTPQLEAQYSGCPLLCSDIPVFREVSGIGAEYCEPCAEDIAQKMEYLINNVERREQLKTLGYTNVKRFDIEKITERIEEVIND